MADTDDVQMDNKWLGPVKSFFLYHILDNPVFWLGVFIVAFFVNDALASYVYNSTVDMPFAPLISTLYDWGMAHGLFWWGIVFIVWSILASYVRFKITRFAIEKGVLVVTRGRFAFSLLNLFQRRDYTVALNLIYDVDVKKTLFQYIFGGGDVYIRTASNDIFHLEFVLEPHQLREYLLENSGIKNKPVIGVY